MCGLSGKWHLGDNHNPSDGFSFWVTKKHGHSIGFLNQPVIEGGKTNIIAKHQTEYWTDRGIEFIEKATQTKEHGKQAKPFFLFLAYNGPYTLSGAMREKCLRRGRIPTSIIRCPHFRVPRRFIHGSAISMT